MMDVIIPAEQRGGRGEAGEGGRGRAGEKRRPKSACMHVRLCYSTGYNIAFLYSCALNAPNSSFALHSPRFFLMYDSPFDPHMWSVINALSRSGASSRLPNKRKRREKRKREEKREREEKKFTIEGKHECQC